MKRRIKAALPALAMLVWFAGCSPSVVESAPSGTVTGSDAEWIQSSDAEDIRSLRVGITTSVASLTPFGVHTTRDAEHLIWEQLCAMDELGGELSGVIAKSWKTIDNGATWDIEIYDYVYDTAGNHITAEDVAFSCQQTMGVGPMAKCTSCQVLDTYKVRIGLADNAPGSLNSVLTSFNIVSKKAYESSPDGMATAAVGTTPFVVTDFAAGSYVSLKRAESYWQTDESLQSMFARATVDEITLLTIQGAAQQSVALETGVVDAVDSLDATEAAKFEEGGEYAGAFTLYEHPMIKFYLNIFSGDSGSVFCDDLNLRLAVAYAIDVEDVIARALDGRGEGIPYLGNPFFSDVPTEDDSYFDHNLDLARAYLEKSRYSGETVRLVYQNEEYGAKICQIMAEHLEAIGIEVEPMGYDTTIWQSVYADASRYDMVVTSIGAHDANVTAWQNPFQIMADTGVSKAGGWNVEAWKELIGILNTPEGYTQENIDAFQDLMNQNMYALGLLRYYCCEVWDKDTAIVRVPLGYKAEALWWCAEFAGYMWT